MVSSHRTFAVLNLVGILLLRINILLLFSDRNEQSGKNIFSLFKRTKATEQIFVLRTFHFSQGKEDRSSTVTLLNVDNRLLHRVHWFDAKCFVHSSGGLFHTRHVATRLIILHSVGQCRLAICALICPHGRPVDKVVFRFAGSKPLTFPVSVSTPAQKKTTLLLCMGRVFFFEQWHLFVTAMEFYRMQRVDTVVAYVMSVHPTLYELMRLYEREGLLKLRANMEMPTETVHGTGDRFNPNAETEWNNQVVDLHDCLYEHRDSAEFIAFLDWDDLLVSPNFAPLPGIMKKFSAYNADAASFLVSRFHGYLHTLESFSAQKFSLRNFWDNWLIFDKNYLQDGKQKIVGKIVVRPKFTESVNYHFANKLADGYRQIEMPLNGTFILHLRLKKPIFAADKLQIDGAQLQKTFLDFLHRQNSSMEAIGERMPTKEAAIGEFVRCYLASTPDEDRAKNLKRKCPSIHHCPINRTKIELATQECVNNVNVWSLYTSHLRGIAISIWQRNAFERTSRCKFM